MSEIALKKWDYEAYRLETQEGTYFEIIEGEQVVAAAPNRRHQEVLANLTAAMLPFIRQHRLGKLLFAPFEVRLADEVVVQPDLLFVSREREQVLDVHGATASPDLVVEVVSPSSVFHDQHRKKALYERFGVREYWIVDPANEAIEVFVLEEGRYVLHAFAAQAGAVTSRVLDGLVLHVEHVMAD